MVAVVLGTGLVFRHLAGLTAFADGSQAVEQTAFSCSELCVLGLGTLDGLYCQCTFGCLVLLHGMDGDGCWRDHLDCSQLLSWPLSCRFCDFYFLPLSSIFVKW